MDTKAVIFGKLLLVGVVVLALIAGAFVWFVVIYQQRLLAHQQELLQAVIAAQEAERERIGRDLHDDIASSLAMAKMLVDRLAIVPPADDAATLLGLAREVLSDAVEEVRNVSHSLYPAMLSRVGLLYALEHLAAVCRRTETLTVELDTHYPHPLPLTQELALYRICQELVHNTLKHAVGATRLVIRLQQQGQHLLLAVEDDGCGFVVSEAGQLIKEGVGLRSIGVRVEMLQARLVRQSALGQGTRTRIELDEVAAK